MEGEEGVGFGLGFEAAVGAPEHEEPGRPLRLPLEVFDEWLAAEEKLQWVDDVRELHQDEVVLRQAKAVDVTGLLDRRPAKDLSTSRLAGHTVGVVGADPREMGEIVEGLPGA